MKGAPEQGGLMFGQVAPGSSVTLDGKPVMVSGQGRFVIGFGRDEEGTRQLHVSGPAEPEQTVALEVAKREYRIERVDGLPPSKVTPPPEVTARIR